MVRSLGSPRPSPSPCGITTKGRAGHVPVRPRCAPGSRLRPRDGGWKGGRGPPRPGDPTPGWSPGGGSPCWPGLRARGGARGSPGLASRRTHRPTDAWKGGPPDGQRIRQTAARPLRLPGRNGFRAGRDRSREKARRRRRRRRPEEGKREGARARAGRRGRQAAGRPRNEEACGHRFPAGDRERPVRGPLPNSSQGSGGAEGGGSRDTIAAPSPRPAP